ncbi:MAG TPA: hypothetical protein PLA68_11645 [Panacibacter sp.]|nr:hypothetical protein [Panacibacter sp.]
MSKRKNKSKKNVEKNPPLNDPGVDATVQKPDENILQPAYTANDRELPITIESADLPVEVIVEGQYKKETPQPLINDMEIHHSSLHHKKKWKEYLFEFLMLFLAVTAGFFVENKREYYIEHERAEQFSKQLLADLRLDSVLFENRKRDIQSMQKGFDSLLYLLTKKSNTADKEILETLLPITFAFDVPANATTYSQMKTSGSLRYIENPDLTAHLQKYYDVLLPRSIRITEASLVYLSEHINPFYLKHIRIQDYDPFNDTLLNKKPFIVERTRQTDQELANIMGGYRSLLTIQTITMNTPALEKIKETIPVLKKEYNLE